MADVEHEKLLKLYELAINEEHHFLDAYQNRVAFFSGILSALVAGTVVGFFKASEWYHLAMLCVGPVLISVISIIAIKGVRRLYQRFLEAVTIRAKVEQELGLTIKHSVNANAADSYWQLEAIVPHRHIESRKEYESSNDFIKGHLKKGYHQWTMYFFYIFIGASIVMLVGILSLMIWKAV